MKKLIIVLLLATISIPLYGQNRALRIDSLEVNDKNVTGFFNDLMSPDLMRIDMDSLIIFTASDSSDSCWIFDTGDTTIIHAQNPFKSRSIFYAQKGIISLSGDNIFADSSNFHSNTLIVSPQNNRIGIGASPASQDSTLYVSGGVYLTGGISVLNITDRTEYIGTKEAIKLLNKINLTGVKSFKDFDDVFILPMELRIREDRNLSRVVSFLIAVVKSQQAEINKLKQR